MILGREAGNIFIYSSPPSLPPLARGELLLCTSKGEPGPPESPAEQALEELGKPGSPLASPASAPDSAALVVSCQDTETSPSLPNQRLLFQSLASLATCMALPNLTLPFLSPCGKTPPVLEVQVALELLSGCCQLWVPTTSPECPPPAPAQPRASAGAPAAPVAATGGLLHKSPEIAMCGLAGRGWADARQTARHQAGCAGLAGGGEEPWSSALGSCRRDAPSWSWGRLAGVEKMVGSISSPRTGLCHRGLMGARVWVGAPPSHGERRKVQLLCRF